MRIHIFYLFNIGSGFDHKKMVRLVCHFGDTIDADIFLGIPFGDGLSKKLHNFGIIKYLKRNEAISKISLKILYRHPGLMRPDFWSIELAICCQQGSAK
jgi:hypothetical protein